MLAFRVNREITLQILGLEHTIPFYRCVVENYEHLRRWFNWVADLRTVDDIKQFILESWNQAKEGTEFHFGVWWRKRLVGMVSVHSIDPWIRAGEIGYWLVKWMEGKGIMTQAVKVIIRFLFVNQQLNRLEIRCAKTNRRSQAIPKRLGFRLAGVFRQAERIKNRWEDLLIYELLKVEWEENQRKCGFDANDLYHLYH